MKNSILLTVIQFATVSVFGQAWTDLSDVPESLTFPVAVVLNDNIHLIGGGAPGGATDLHLRYNPATDVWDTLAPVPYLAQQPAGAVADGKIYYFGGGFPNSGTPLKSNYMYDPVADDWTKVADIPANRVIHEAATIKDSIYVMGGQPDKLRFELYSVKQDNWKQLNNLPDQNFWYGAVVTTMKDEMFRFGGGSFGAPSNKAQKYDVATDSWETLPNMPMTIHAPGAAAIGDSIYLAGGYNDGNIKKMWIYDINTQVYHDGFAMPETRAYHSVVSIGSCVYVIGGNNDAHPEIATSLIRHCVGDTAITGIEDRNTQSMPFTANYQSGKLLIRTDHRFANKPLSVELYDLGGKRIMAGNVRLDENGSGEVEMDLTHVRIESYYIARVQCEFHIQTVKILVSP